MTNLSKLVKFIVQFNFFCIIKDILTSKIVSKIYCSLLQKLKNKIPLCILPMKTIPPVFDEVELAVHGSENA